MISSYFNNGFVAEVKLQYNMYHCVHIVHVNTVLQQ